LGFEPEGVGLACEVAAGAEVGLERPVCRFAEDRVRLSMFAAGTARLRPRARFDELRESPTTKPRFLGSLDIADFRSFRDGELVNKTVVGKEHEKSYSFRRDARLSGAMHVFSGNG
jgi:hypothetical protein